MSINNEQLYMLKASQNYSYIKSTKKNLANRQINKAAKLKNPTKD